MKILPPEAIPQQIHMANGLVDFKNVDDIIASLSLTETGLTLEANVNLKEGHNCVAYNMIRTPHLSTTALQSVPAEAIALVSLALGRPGTPQADAVSQQIMNATGLDIGSDLFANIEQITLFAVPMQGTDQPQDGEIPPQAKSIGLAITSANPQQTRELLTTLLRTANLIAEESDTVDGKYEITLANYGKLFGYMDPANKTTLLSLNPDLIASSVRTMKRRATGTVEGAMKSALDALPGTSSKLVMLNVAGVAQFAAANTDLPEGQQADQVRKAMAQLIQASEKTTAHLQTTEEANSFGIRLSVTDLPSPGKIIGPIMQIQEGLAQITRQQVMAQIASGAGAWDAPKPPAAIAVTDAAPTIDGKAEDVWSAAQAYDLKNSYYGNPSSDSDLSASFKTLYDGDNLYVLVNVSDEQLRNDSDEQWLDDGVEIFIDADNRKGTENDDNDYQYFFSWDAASPTMGEAHYGKTGGIDYALAKTETGYRVEIKFPWATLGTKPAPGTNIGLDVQVNDNDDGGERDSKLAWHAPHDDAWQNPSVYGTGQLLGMIGWWKLDDAAGMSASDSSSHGRTGTLMGDPQWQPSGGRVGGALLLDGVGDYYDSAT